MDRSNIIYYLNNCLQRPTNINMLDLSWLCSVIYNETGKDFLLEDVARAAQANPDRMMKFLEAMWGYLLAKYNITTHTTQGSTFEVLVNKQAVKIIRYA